MGRKPESERGQRAEQTLIRYFTRMSFRVPLLACSRVTQLDELLVLAKERSLLFKSARHIGGHARLDMYYLAALSQALAADASMQRRFTYRVNSSLYRSGEVLRYVFARSTGAGRTYELVAIDPTDYLEESWRRRDCQVFYLRARAGSVDQFLEVVCWIDRNKLIGSTSAC